MKISIYFLRILVYSLSFHLFRLADLDFTCSWYCTYLMCLLGFSWMAKILLEFLTILFIWRLYSFMFIGWIFCVINRFFDMGCSHFIDIFHVFNQILRLIWSHNFDINLVKWLILNKYLIFWCEIIFILVVIINPTNQEYLPV